MRSTVRPDIRDFFARYERAAREPDQEALISAFASNFLSLDSRSATALTPETLLAALPRRKEQFESIGSDGLQLNEIEETPLDDYHALVRTSWQLCMRDAASRPPMILRSTFVLRKQGGAWRIVLYLNHQDMADFFETGGKRFRVEIFQLAIARRLGLPGWARNPERAILSSDHDRCRND